MPELLTTKQAAQFLDYSCRTLQYWRQHQKGPVYTRHEGRVYYHIVDLERWAYQNRCL
jgi:hypothetical protein